jgi:DNA polymerase
MQSSLFEESTATLGSIEDLNAEVLEKGKLRYPNRTFIFGTGPEDADIVVVGESPGPPDISTGKPFSGTSGDLLKRILAAIEIKFEDCYLTNVVKFISQGDEIAIADIAFFTPFLHREILALEPKLIVLLGNTPAKAVLNTKTPISKLRGEVHSFHGIKTVATFNPAFVLRDPTKKREVWDDMKLARDLLK